MNKTEQTKNRKFHNIQPVYDENSKILILGSFPSVKSRESKFFYGHPQNRFWKLMAALMNTDVPDTVDEKKKFLLDNHIAVWDVIESCEIVGSSDSSIKNVVPNNIEIILEKADIEMIICNGNKSFQLYRKYLEDRTKRSAVCMPSTSPANASYQMDRLIENWQKITSAM